MKTRRALVVVLISLLASQGLCAQAVRNFKQTGSATQTLDAPGLAIAHPSLPLGTQVQVTNNANNQKTTATVAARIPASSDRITDVSSALASAIALPGTGANVTLEVVNNRPQRDTTPPPPAQDLPVEEPVAAPVDEPPPPEEPVDEMPEEPPYEPPAPVLAEEPAPAPEPAPAQPPADRGPDRLTIVYPPYYPPYPNPNQNTVPSQNGGYQELANRAEPASSTSASPVIAPAPASAPSTSSMPSNASNPSNSSNPSMISPVTTTSPTNSPTSQPAMSTPMSTPMMGPTVAMQSPQPQNQNSTSSTMTPNIMVIPIYTTPGSEQGRQNQSPYGYPATPAVPEPVPQPVQQYQPAVQAAPQPPQQYQPPPQAAPQQYQPPAQQYQPPVPPQQPAQAWPQNPQPAPAPQQQPDWTAQQQPWNGPQQQPAPAARPARQQMLDYSRPPALVRPSMPPAAGGRNYRVQVGAYRSTINAREVFDHLVNAGFNPAYERYGDVYRVVLSGVRAQDMTEVARLLGAAGFQEVIIREE